MKCNVDIISEANFEEQDSISDYHLNYDENLDVEDYVGCTTYIKCIKNVNPKHSFKCDLLISNLNKRVKASRYHDIIDKLKDKSFIIEGTFLITQDADIIDIFKDYKTIKINNKTVIELPYEFLYYIIISKIRYSVHGNITLINFNMTTKIEGVSLQFILDAYTKQFREYEKEDELEICYTKVKASITTGCYNLKDILEYEESLKNKRDVLRLTEAYRVYNRLNYVTRYKKVNTNTVALDHFNLSISCADTFIKDMDSIIHMLDGTSLKI
ncbi:hypothetical protein D3C87_1041320 [compost metagenome]